MDMEIDSYGASSKRTRKRSDSSPEPDVHDNVQHGSYAPKRNWVKNELEALGLIPQGDAWLFDTSALCASIVAAQEQDGDVPMETCPSNIIFIICVVGHVALHLQLLSQQLPTLCQISPNLQAVALAHDADGIRSLPINMPVVQDVGPPQSYFSSLGVVHPSGDGTQPLDSIVLIDGSGKRRLVLPFGWGAGRHVYELTGGRMVQDKLMEVLRTSIETLEQESSNEA
ncbi:hypothetical protein BJ546DRAFT_380211 [Cryomyces antarcticus]